MASCLSSHHFALLFSVLLLISPARAIQIWTSPAALPSVIPASCRAALSTNITCSPRLLAGSEVEAQSDPGNVFLQQYCTSACQASLLSFQSGVHARCGSTSYAFSNRTNQSGNAIADPLVWAYTVSCDKDTKTSNFCLPEILKGTVTACDNCTLRYAANLLGSTYGNVRINPQGFSSLLSSCGVPASMFPYSTVASTSTSSSTAASATCTGKQYTVVSTDTCLSISRKNSIALDRLLTQNSIDYNCKSLQTGQILCLGASCKLHTVAVNETCASIVDAGTFTTTELISWNPTIHYNCDNLGSMIGRPICISPPGTTSYLTPNATSGAIGATTTSMNTSSFITWASSFTPGSSIGGPTSNFSTTLLQATFGDPVTSTANITSSLITAYQNATKYCPVSDSDLENGFSWEDLPQACLDLLEPYCNGSPNGTNLASRHFPASCSPAFYLTVSGAAVTTTSANVVAGPLTNSVSKIPSSTHVSSTAGTRVSTSSAGTKSATSSSKAAS